jgi:ubiquinone/menaquinone biosynthesis C-methylase UbiE
MSTQPSGEIDRIKQIYETTYRRDPKDRTYIWHPLNPVSIYYRQSQERAITNLIRDIGLPIEDFQTLDVGCGKGGFLRFLASLGIPPENLHGLDLMDYRIVGARKVCPPMTRLQIGNAENLPYLDQSFDLVSQFTVFSSILSDELRKKVAAEIMRVLKPGGHVLWYDMRQVKSDTTRGIELDELRALFDSCSIRALYPLHTRRTSFFAKRSTLLCMIWDQIPLLYNTHYLALLKRP